MPFCSLAWTSRFESAAGTHGMRAHDLPEPSREGRRLAQILQAVECGEEGVLDGILSQVTIVEKMDSEIHGVAAESTHQRRGGGVISLDASGQEFFEKLRHTTSALHPSGMSHVIVARFGLSLSFL